MALTAKQERFVEEYLIDGDSTQAAIRAGYSERGAKAAGVHNLNVEAIKKAIDKASKPDLTRKQEAFCLAFLETGNAAEAYRRSYDVADAAKDSWIYVEACQLLDNPKIALRVDQLQEEARRLALFNVAKASEEYEEARKMAMKVGNPSAAVSATQGKVKLFGLEAPTKRLHEHSGPNGGPMQTINHNMSPAEAEGAYADTLNDAEG